jgi:hypothetical protein
VTSNDGIDAIILIDSDARKSAKAHIAAHLDQSQKAV